MKKETMQLFYKACNWLGYDPEKVLPDVSSLPEHLQQSSNAYNMLMIIIEYAQKKKKWQADYSDPNQRKYWTWHWVKASEDKPAGFGFSYSSYVCDNTGSFVGVRLCFPDYETEREYAEKLEELYLKFKL